MENSFSDWCIKKHADTNHMYDKYLPYEFHLRMVVKAASDFQHLWPKEEIFKGGINNDPRKHFFETILWKDVIPDACWGHDLIEDARVSYNDIWEKVGTDISDIIYACTNLRGKNRAERGSEEYYKLIRETPGADFVKLCDRIANVQYSKMSGSRMFDMYKKENFKFIGRIGKNYPPMIDYLNKLFYE